MSASEDYSELSEADLDAVLDTDELRRIAKFLLRQQNEDVNDQVEQRINSLEQRLDERDEQIGALHAALHELRTFKDSVPESTPVCTRSKSVEVLLA
jgi:chaperonin cofactor prefoldin